MLKKKNTKRFKTFEADETRLNGVVKVIQSIYRRFKNGFKNIIEKMSTPEEE